MGTRRWLCGRGGVERVVRGVGGGEKGRYASRGVGSDTWKGGGPAANQKPSCRMAGLVAWPGLIPSREQVREIHQSFAINHNSNADPSPSHSPNTDASRSPNTNLGPSTTWAQARARTWIQG